ncbi:hypothetical protein B0A49_12332 [Cryomyces minteri]|uniref:Uncharacterized protein n=1 Tax=Cryomyces minteri TaxID=331657 RepID=A0A4U0VL13_9PEZI|nr:hypothetical protein B0A49_12332 [Cryomyces minteri]
MPRDHHPGARQASGPRSLGVIEIEDIDMSDAADSDVLEIDGVNKRKRTTPSPQKARKHRGSQNRADLSSTEAQSPSEHIAIKRRTRKQSLKAREAQKVQKELGKHSHGTQRARGDQDQDQDQDQDIMSLLREMNRNTAEMNKRMAQMEKSNAEKEEAYKGQIARLEELVQAMQVDLARTMAGSFGSRSFASVPSSGVPLSRTTSRVSFDVSPPRDSPLHTPSRSSTTTPQRSALRDPSKDPIGNGSRVTMDLKLLNEEDTAELDTPPKIRDRLEKGLQSIGGVQDIKLKDFNMWHTNDSVKIIRFVVSKEEEKLIRQYSHEWVPAYLRGARLIGPQWFAIKVDCVDRAFATDASTNKMREDAGQIFGEENGVKVHSMRRLGTPRADAVHASTVVKVDTKEEAERLLITFAALRPVTSADASVILRKTAPSQLAAARAGRKAMQDANQQRSAALTADSRTMQLTATAQCT